MSDGKHTTVICSHCGDVTEQPPPLLTEYLCGKCGKPFRTQIIPFWAEDFKAQCEAFTSLNGHNESDEEGMNHLVSWIANKLDAAYRAGVHDGYNLGRRGYGDR